MSAQATNRAPTASGHDQSKPAGTAIPLSQLFTFSDPDSGDSVTQFAVRDRTSGGGYLTRNGVRQTDGQLYDNIPISDLGNWAFVAGPGGSTDQIGFNAYDSHGAISSSATANVTALAVNQAPSAQGHDQSKSAGTAIPLSQLFTFSDPDSGDSVTQFAVRDRTSGGGYLTRNGVRQTDGQLYDNIPISDLGNWAFVAGPGGSTDQIGFNAYDSHGAISSSATANVTALAVNQAPSAVGHDQSKTAGTAIPLSQLFTFSDPDSGDSVVKFAVKDRSSGGGYLTRNGVRQTDGQLYDNIAISDLGNWAFVTGPAGSTDQIGFNAYDSHGAISASATATVTGLVVNQAPSAVGHDQSKTAGTAIPLSQLFTFSDPDSGDSVVKFAVKDRSSGGGYLTRNGVRQTDGQLYDNIAISDLGNWAFVTGPAASTDQIGFNAYDSHGAISSSATANVTGLAANQAPTATGHDQTKAAGTAIPLSQLFTFSDPDSGDSVVKFAVKDRSTGGGYLTRNGVRQTDGQLYDNIAISDLANWAFVAGPAGSTDQIGFNAYDSHGAISASATATVTVTAQAQNHAPTAQGHDQTKTAGAATPLSTLFTFSDPDAGDSVTQFAVKDVTTGGGYLTRNGVRQTDGQAFDHIAISDLGNWAFVAGVAGSTDQISFSAYDSHGQVSASVTASVAVPGNVSTAPQATAHSQSAAPGTSIPLSQLFTFTGAVVSFDVKDRTSDDGYLTLNGVRHPITDYTLITGSPISDLSKWAFVVGSSGSTDQIGFTVYDSQGRASTTVAATVTGTGGTLAPHIGLPFSADQQVLVTQGFGGSLDHGGGKSAFDKLLYYAVDLAPIGYNKANPTPVLAQGVGTVIAIVDNIRDLPAGGYNSNGALAPYLGDYTYMGPHNLGNYITIQYKNGVIATYNHLKQGSIALSKLKVNDPVALGQQIGLVGLSGNTGGPHLHVTYGINRVQGDNIADGSLAGNPNGSPVYFSQSPDGVLHLGQPYHGDIAVAHTAAESATQVNVAGGPAAPLASAPSLFAVQHPTSAGHAPLSRVEIGGPVEASLSSDEQQSDVSIAGVGTSLDDAAWPTRELSVTDMQSDSLPGGATVAAMQESAPPDPAQIQADARLRQAIAGFAADPGADAPVWRRGDPNADPAALAGSADWRQARGAARL